MKSKVLVLVFVFVYRVRNIPEYVSVTKFNGVYGGFMWFIKSEIYQIYNIKLNVYLDGYLYKFTLMKVT